MMSGAATLSGANAATVFRPFDGEDALKNWGFVGHGRIRAFLGLSALTFIIGTASSASASQDIADSTDDALACPDDTTAAAAKALHFAGSADFWSGRWNFACRLDPDHPDRAIVALTYLPGEERTGLKHAGDDLHERNLELVVIDLSNGEIVAHRHEDKVIEDGGERLEGISIDTGRYTLAPGKRAFGVRVSNGTHCACVNVSYTNLYLYVQNGRGLDRVLSTSVENDQDGYEKYSPQPPACTSIGTTTTTTIAVGRGKSHGLADLQRVTIETPRYEFDDSSKCPTLPATKRRVTLRYDCEVYK